MFKILLLACICCTIVISTEGSIGGYISQVETKKFLDIFSRHLQTEGNAYYGAQGYKILGAEVPEVTAKATCPHLQTQFKPDMALEASFNVLKAWSLLKCPGKLNTDDTIKNARSALENPKSSTTDLHFASEILLTLGQSLSAPGRIAQNVQAKLKEDDSLLSLGHALHIAALLGDAGKFINDRVEEIVVQADEVDGSILQWEGGLTTTSLLLTGILKLQNVIPFTQVQADKLGNYLLSRCTVQTPKGILAVLEAAEALSNSKVSPVAISVVGAPYVTLDKPDLKVKVGDLFGRKSKSVTTPVVAQSATRISDDVVVLAKQALAPGPNPTEFNLPLKLEPGFYRISLASGQNTITLNTRVLGPISVQNLEIGLVDADGSSAPKLTKLEHPGRLSSSLQGDAGQHLVVKFTISRSVHQAFLRLYSEKKEIVFVAEKDSSKAYKVDVNLATDLSYSDSFQMELILGDAAVSNPIRWNLGTLEASLNNPAPTAKLVRLPKEEIKHMFRQADKRPAQVVSSFFTLLTIAPVLLLLGLWSKMGVNCANFSVLAVPFHLGFGAILALFVLFWLKLDMFTTCAWLLPVGGFTFFSGHKLLSSIACRNTCTTKKG